MLFSLLISMSWACNKNELPKDILSQEQMGEILKEMQMLRVAITDDAKNRDIYSPKRNELVNQILERQGTKREKFYESYRYYTQHPKLLEEIYDKILLDLNKLLLEENKHKQSN